MLPQWPALPEHHIRAAVAERRAALAAWPFELLATLPAVGAHQASLDRRPIELWTYVDRVDDRIRVVVQLTARPSRALPSNQVYAEGFIRSPDGSTDELGLSDLQEFLPPWGAIAPGGQR